MNAIHEFTKRMFTRRIFRGTAIMTAILLWAVLFADLSASQTRKLGKDERFLGESLVTGAFADYSRQTSAISLRRVRLAIIEDMIRDSQPDPADLDMRLSSLPALLNSGKTGDLACLAVSSADTGKPILYFDDVFVNRIDTAVAAEKSLYKPFSERRTPTVSRPTTVPSAEKPVINTAVQEKQPIPEKQSTAGKEKKDNKAKPDNKNSPEKSSDVKEVKPTEKPAPDNSAPVKEVKKDRKPEPKKPAAVKEVKKDRKPEPKKPAPAQEAKTDRKPEPQKQEKPDSDKPPASGSKKKGK